MVCGCRLIECKDGLGRGSGAEGSGATGGNLTIPVALLFPAEGVEQMQRFGPYEIELAIGAEPIGQNLPVVVISHGNGSTSWVFRDLAKHLAKVGFVVALPEHPGNNRRDNSLAGTVQNLENRPRHISAVIDAVASDPVLSGHIAPANVGIIGHSIGAYTALAVAGGKPWSAPHEIKDRKSRPVPVVSDKRVRSLVLLNPATFWFIPETLKEVQIPVLILTGEEDQITPPALAQTVIDGVFDRMLVRDKVIAGAGHFSFLSKFPSEMIRPDFPPSQDPPGFNREEFQPSLFADIGGFLGDSL
jgi:predicted dienelactone hydrolase